MEENNKSKLARISIVFIFFLMVFFLFFKQSDGTYPSDLVFHIKAALANTGSDYTIVKPIFRFLHSLFKSNIGVCGFLAIIASATIYLMFIIFEKLLPNENKNVLFIYALICNFVIAIYIKFIDPYMNLGVLEGNEWHNSTFTCMKFVGLIVLMLYFKIDENYLIKIKVKDWILYTLLLILINMIKPNFIITFAPAMLVVFIIDLIKTKGKGSVNIILFGITVLISLSVLIYQYTVLFVDDPGSGIAIGFAKVISHHNPHWGIGLLQALAFPLGVLICNLKQLKIDRKYRFSWILVLIGAIQYIFLYETGERMYDGNFDWGLSFAMGVIFIISLAIMDKKLHLDAKSQEKSIKTIVLDNKLYLFIYFLLLLHTLSGLFYFVKMLTGGSYY